jgi:hypothetical protein
MLGDFKINLRDHAREDQVEHKVGDVAEESREVLQGGDEDGRDAADARQQLESVAEAHDAVVTRVGCQLLLVHDKHTRRRHGRADAARDLEAQAAAGAVLLSHLSRLEATARAEVSLAADVPGHVVLEGAATHLEDGAGRAEEGETTAAKVVTRCVQEGSLELIRIVTARIFLAVLLLVDTHQTHGCTVGVSECNFRESNAFRMKLQLRP